METPIGLPTEEYSADADTVWVYFSRKATPTGYRDDLVWSVGEKYLAAELEDAKRMVREFHDALASSYGDAMRDGSVTITPPTEELGI